MALIANTTMSIFRGDVPINQDSDTANTLSATVNAHLLTIHTGSLVSINTSAIPKNNHTTELVVTVIHVSGSGHTYMNQP
jgi:hypothetical protein